MSLEKIALLFQQAHENNDVDALNELKQLIESDAVAFENYTRLLWLESRLPFSNLLIRSGDDSAINEREPAAAIVAPTESFVPSRFHLAALAACLLVAASLVWLFVSPPKQQTAAVDVEHSQQIAQQPTQQVTEKVSVPAVTFNELAHPPKRGGISGGVVIDEAPVPEVVSFNFHVRPILSENCFFCHGPDPNHREADLRLDTAEGYLDAVEPGSPDDSELVSRIFEEDAELLMPPHESGRSLSTRQKAILQKWIEQGAQHEQHWAFAAPIRPAVPEVKREDWPKNPIDNFVLAKLESRSIDPSPRAEPTTIVRRLYLDLIGLPPTPEETSDFQNAYEADPEDAVNSTVDRLLSSKHYGERMSLPWLDASRYSDSNGFQQDGDRSQWPWRDWVVRAMNENMPFDQFTIEQIAGDLLEEPSQDQLIATGFNRNHMLNGEGGAIAEEQRNNYVFDRVDATATTWLGLTMACAQCHDHKYDPITHEDYYKFFAYFNNVDERGNVDRKVGRRQVATPFIEVPTEEQSEALNSIAKELKPLNESISKQDAEITKAMRAWEVEARKQTFKNMGRDIFNALLKLPEERNRGEENRVKEWFLRNVAKDEWKELKKNQDKLQADRRKVMENVLTVMVMRERKQPRQTFILDRGNYEARLDEVKANIPHFLPGLDIPDGSSRLDLARWLVSEENPLTSRVQVNRYWQLFFGTGIVKTTEDFGVQSELPSHPELLDWLAVEFQESGWDVKHMHRLIVTSETYLQSSKFRKDLIETDPANRLLARSPRFRMSSMLIRDSALKVSGLFNATIGGAPVYPWQPDRLWKEFSLERFGYKPSDGNDRYRRSLYTFWRRTVPPPNMFDSSSRQTCTVKSSRTNTPLHALTLLNDPTFVEAACYLASDVLANSKGGPDDRVELVESAFRRSVGREPGQAEIASLTTAFDESREYYLANQSDAKGYLAVAPSVTVPEDDEELVTLAALSSVAQVILNTDEFMTRE